MGLIRLDLSLGGFWVTRVAGWKRFSLLLFYLSTLWGIPRWHPEKYILYCHLSPIHTVIAEKPIFESHKNMAYGFHIYWLISKHPKMYIIFNWSISLKRCPKYYMVVFFLSSKDCVTVMQLQPKTIKL